MRTIEQTICPWRPVAIVEKYAQSAVDYVRCVTGIQDPDGATLARHVEPYSVLRIEGDQCGLIDPNNMVGLFARNGHAISRCPIDPTYPRLSNGVVVFRSTFGADEANFPWDAVGLESPAGTVLLLDQEVAPWGVKSAGTWVLTVMAEVL